MAPNRRSSTADDAEQRDEPGRHRGQERRAGPPDGVFRPEDTARCPLLGRGSAADRPPGIDPIDGDDDFTGVDQRRHRLGEPARRGRPRSGLSAGLPRLPRLVAEPQSGSPIDLCAAAFLQNRAADDGAARDGRDGCRARPMRSPPPCMSDTTCRPGEATSAVTPTVVRRSEGARAGGRRWRRRSASRPNASLRAASAAAADALDAFYRRSTCRLASASSGYPRRSCAAARDTLKNFNANRGARPADHVDQMLQLLRACW